MNKMKQYADKYFLRANEILKADSLNPWINMQVFVRKGPGKAAGIDEAVSLITSNSNIEKAGGRIYAKRDGQEYSAKETLMNIIAPAQEIIELETVYLGVIAAAMTRENDHKDIDLRAIQKNVEMVADLAGGRPVIYFGARHWHYIMDSEISRAVFAGGAADCSTDIGAGVAGKKGVGTIPHALENVYAYYYGIENAVAESTKAFDRHIERCVPRIALVDYANREITDTIRTIESLAVDDNGMYRTMLDAVRVDTCGENAAEGGITGDGRKYWTGRGVTVSGVASLRAAMDAHPAGKEVKIVLSSGFSSPEKVKAFNECERYLGIRLYDSIGAGFLDGVRTSTADIVAVGMSPDEVDYTSSGGVPERNIIHKAGRTPLINETLERRL